MARNALRCAAPIAHNPRDMTVCVAGMHHAGVHVTDLERSIGFYATVFGLSVANRFTFGNEELAFLQVGTVQLELIADRAGSRTTGVVDHVAFEVDDVDSWLGRLRQHGVILLDQAPIEVAQLYARIAFCLGPDGERIELLEQHGPEARAV
jgi:catechol 2,3-dioxygenase-like lactoylglutathione lyase family enzyme